MNVAIPHRNCGDMAHVVDDDYCIACDHAISDRGVAIPWEKPNCPIDCQSNYMQCPFFDYITGARCSQTDGHPPFHTIPDGTAFGIGYTLKEASEWSH